MEQTLFNSLQAVVSPLSKLAILLYQNGGSLKALYCNDVTCASATKTTVRNSGTNDIFAVTIDSNDTLHLAIADYEPMIFYIRYNMQNNYFRRDKTNIELSTIYDIDIQIDPNTTLPVISTIQDSVQIITCYDINCYAWTILQQYGSPSDYDIIARTSLDNEWTSYVQGCWSGLLVANINTDNYTIAYDRQLLPITNQTCTMEASIVDGQLSIVVGTQDPSNGATSSVRYLHCNAQDCSSSNVQSLLLSSATDASFTPQVTSSIQGSAVTLFYQNSSSLFAVICTSPSCTSYQQFDLYTLMSNPPITPPVEPPTNPPVNPPVEPPVNPPVEPPVNPPIEPPVNPPVEPPVNPPVQPPVEPPTNPPVTPPVQPPVKPPVEPPVAPISPPVPVPHTPISEPAPVASPSEAPNQNSPTVTPVNAPADQKDSTIDWIISGSIIGAVLIVVAVLLVLKLRKPKPADEFQRLLDEPTPTINSQEYYKH